MNTQLDLFLKELKSKPLIEYAVVELADKIDEISELYFKTNLKEEKKVIQSIYTKMVNQVNKLTGKRTFKILITKD